MVAGLERDPQVIATIEATRFWGNEPGYLPVCYFEIWVKGSLIRVGESARLIWVEGQKIP
jgi:hypothetical protein